MPVSRTASALVPMTGPVHGRRMVRRVKTGRQDGALRDAGRLSRAWHFISTSRSPHCAGLCLALKPDGCESAVECAFRAPSRRDEGGKRCASPGRHPLFEGARIKSLAVPLPLLCPRCCHQRSFLSFIFRSARLRFHEFPPHSRSHQTAPPPTHHHVCSQRCPRRRRPPEARPAHRPRRRRMEGARQRRPGAPQRAPQLQVARVVPAVDQLAVGLLHAHRHVPHHLLRAVRDVRQDAPPHAQQRKPQRVLARQHFVPAPLRQRRRVPVGRPRRHAARRHPRQVQSRGQLHQRSPPGVLLRAVQHGPAGQGGGGPGEGRRRRGAVPGAWRHDVPRQAVDGWAVMLGKMTKKTTGSVGKVEGGINVESEPAISRILLFFC